MKNDRLFGIVESIAALPHDWHKAGSMSRPVLETIADYCGQIQPIRFSVETGSGKTTLLFSHASMEHKVFAVEDGNGSITQVKASELFNRATTEYIEGPTQRTLPAYAFKHPIDIALIDGPHGYPFPDFEYFHLYPHIRQGGLLLIDDIQIPTIGRMFQIIEADAMWRLRDVVDNMAIFERTGHEGVSAYEDGWWKQGYNEKLYKGMISRNKRDTSLPFRIMRKVKRTFKMMFAAEPRR